ncbi:MAG: MATE family efflux transporter [Saprospiraceae bacterium]|nr:MATE family efflux transporter [Saprospiraceae bacterium]MDW8484104.1 MATE family efflux transporter [Saprospiraceae bacterium]
MLTRHHNTERTEVAITRKRTWYRLLRQALSGAELNYTRGSIDRAIILLAIPMILEMVMESLFVVIDAYFVAQLSKEAITTLGLTESVLTIVYAVSIGLSAAATAMVSRRVGEGRRRAAAVVGAQALLVAVLLSALLAIPGYWFAEDILRLMSRDLAVATTGTPFTRLLLTFNLPILLLWMLNGVFRGAGDAATAMRALWLANGVNLVLDPVLIFGFGPFPELGLLGAGVATVVGRSAGVLYQLWHLFAVGRVVHLHIRFMLRPYWNLVRRLLILASGSTGQYLIASSSWIFLIGILGQIDTALTAGYTLAIRIMLFTLLPSWGLANAAATLVGQNLGANQPERAERSVWRAGFFNMVFLAVVGLFYILAAPLLIGLFTRDSQTVSSGALALRIISTGYVFYGYSMILSQAINGAGDTRTPTLLNFVCFWLIEAPLAWWLAMELNWQEEGVYYSIVFAESLLALILAAVFRTGYWKRTIV